MRRQLGTSAAQSLGAPPSSPVTGQFYWDTGASLLRAWDGATWRPIAPTEPYVFAFSGVVAVRTGASRVYLEAGYAIETVRASVGTAPAGASLIVDVNVNGTTIYGTQGNRPTIAAGANTGLGGAASTATVTAGQFLTVDVDQVGSTTAGSDLTVVVRLRRTAS